MKMYTVVGVSRFGFTDKKTGQAKTMTKLSLTYSDPDDKNLIGCGVREVTPFDSVFQRSGYEPIVGDQVNLVFDEGYDGKARLVQIVPV